MDGRASRGPGRAVGAARQSTAMDLGVGGRPARVSVCGRPASWRGPFFDTPRLDQLAGGPQGGRAGCWGAAGGVVFKTLKSSFFCYMGSCGKFSTHSNFASWWWAIFRHTQVGPVDGDPWAGASGGAGAAFDTPKLTSSQWAIFRHTQIGQLAMGPWPRTPARGLTRGRFSTHPNSPVHGGHFSTHPTLTS